MMLLLFRRNKILGHMICAQEGHHFQLLIRIIRIFNRLCIDKNIINTMIDLTLNKNKKYITIIYIN